jgi:predicted ATPase/DNA-binding CsgD family transcriptional regulator
VGSELLTVLTPLVGREREISLVGRRLDSARLVTITGLGGAGKTRLALEVVAAWERSGRWVRFVDLSGATARPAAAAQIALALEVRETAELDTEQAIGAALAGGTIERLLVLDNLEQLSDATGLVVRLLTAASNLRVLITSRVPMGIPGETEVALSALELPADETPDAVEASAAGALFLARARAIGRLEALSPDEARDVAGLCRRLDGLPLALELAAARMRILSAGAILRRLQTHEAVLGTELPERHRSLEAVLDWSVGLLTDSQRATLLSVSVCVGGFDLAMAEALCPDIDALETLAALAGHGLVRVEPEVAGEPRFRLLEMVRAAALRRLEPAALDVLWRRHAERMLAFADGLGRDLRGTGARSAIERIDADIENVRAALDWTEQADPAMGLAIAWSMRDYWRQQGRLRGGSSRLRRLLELEPGETIARARGLAALADVERELVGPIAMLAIAESAARLGRDLGDLASEMVGLVGVVLARAAAGDTLGVQESESRLAKLARETGDLEIAIEASFAAAAAASTRNDRNALHHLRTAAELARTSGDAKLEGSMWGNLALTHLALQEPERALEAATSAIALLRTIGQTAGLAWALGHQGSALAQLGRRDAAVGAVDESAAIALELDSPEQTADTLRSAMALALADEDAELVGRLWGASEAALAAVGATSQEVDRHLAEPLLARARRLADPVRVELAIRAGSEADPQAVLEELRQRLAEPRSDAPGAPRVHLAHGELTARELEIIGLIGEGRSDADIAEALFISPKTVSVHVSNAKGKLGATSRLDLALRARELLAGR